LHSEFADKVARGQVVDEVKPASEYKNRMRYHKLALKVSKTVCDKQAAYGDSFGKSGAVMKILYPDGIRPDQYDDALCVVRIIDKLFRIATSKDAFGESPYADICGYSLLGAANAENQR
jgi:hypothetical protein